MPLDAPFSVAGVLTFLFGPIGLLCYIGLRTWRTRTLEPA
jgi:hypothetical protein